MRHFTFLSMAAVALACSMQASAQTMTVTTDVMDPATEGSLVKIIADAPAGKHIDIEFNFDGTELVYKMGKAMEIKGKDITINGVNKKNGKRVVMSAPMFMGTDGKETASPLFNVTTDGKLALKNVEITGCRKIVMYCQDNGVLNISDSRFYENRDIKATGGNNGGVLRHSGGTVTIERSVFEKNEGNGGYGGGAICTYNTENKACSMTMRACTFKENTSATSGGAYAVNLRNNNTVPTVLIENCTFAGNFVSDRGGAIYMQDAHAPAKNDKAFSPVLVNNTFVGNASGKEKEDTGGAINFWARSSAVIMTPILFNNLFASNHLAVFNETEDHMSDIRCFYLDGDTSGETVLTQTVKPSVANNLFCGTENKFYSVYGSKNNNGKVDFEKDPIFLEKTDNLLGGDEPDEIHFTAKLYSDLCIAAIAKNSVAIGKGVASFEGINAPATDQYGNKRPAKPAVGAAEYTEDTATGVNTVAAAATDKAQLFLANGAIVATGFEGAATLDVVNVAGQWMFSATVTNGQQVAVDALPAGVYVARMNGASVKFVK